MGAFDINIKLADIKASFKNFVVGFNKEEKKISIQMSDESTHMHYHNEFGLSDEAILALPSQKIGDFLKHKTLLNYEVALKDKPEALDKILAKYNQNAILMGALTTTASNVLITPMPSGDFLHQIPKVIEQNILYSFDSKDDQL